MCVRMCAGVCGCGWVCTGVGRCSRVCVGVRGCAGGGVHRCAWVWEGVGRRGVRGCALVYACVWDEFSEFFLETRVLTSADFNIYPIRILLSLLDNTPMWVHYLKENVQCIVFTIYYLVLQMKMMDQNATNLSWCLVMEEQKILQKY